MPATAALTARQIKNADRKAQAARIAAAHAETAAVVATGCCPRCGSGLRRNLSITGWWQCEQYGAVGFRARPADAACSWQGFTA
jgi:hypothetical protein